ncbi:MmcQ/YjbR family DNA-binding protein [Nocardia macrotermitis]|uniref:MmcQ/YjbR family DNA-binding protein n=1 Tax=Nocardia macrotermitis TaxID=2585198 RepID=A0A7K0D633_9NOCA|nr:MmcQ/YjbR family DNA-binding protein [Nocardia macrotermitis]MQY20294.1 hypothetical protein [Nocardia macrotermitis]
MADSADVRTIALGLPETTEQPHFDMASFRIRGKIFATLPDPDHLHVMLSEEDIHAAVAEHPDICEEKWWGKRLSATRITLPRITTPLLTELLTDAWRNKAPRTLVRAFDENSGR